MTSDRGTADHETTDHRPAGQGEPTAEPTMTPVDVNCTLTAIAAVGANGVIGDGQGLLWHLPEDFARFKRVTMGGVLLMGRRTFDSLGGALPGRQSVVISRSAGAAVVSCPLSDGSHKDLGHLITAEATRTWPRCHATAFGPTAATPGMTRPAASAPGATPLDRDIPAFGATVLVAGTIEQALRLLSTYPDHAWWSVGGGQIYAELWSYTTDLDLTEVQASPVGAVTFPPVDPADWIELSRDPRPEFDFVRYRRRTLAAQQHLAAVLTGTHPPT
jgi:dihydrofolate reductase